MAIERVVVEVHLGVEGEQPAVGGGDERVDLDQRRVGIFGGTRQRHHELHRAADVLRLQPEAEGDFARLKATQPEAGNQMLLDDGMGILGGDLFDLHATRGRCHEDIAAGDAVEHDAEVQLARDGQGLFDQQPLHDLALGPGLVRDQLHAQHLGCELGGFFRRFGELDAAALAAASGVNLRFDHDAGRALLKQRTRRVERLIARLNHLAARHRHSILSQNGFSLVLVNFHVGMTTARAGCPTLAFNWLGWVRERDAPNPSGLSTPYKDGATVRKPVIV